MKIEMCDETRTTIVSSIALVCCFTAIIVAIVTNEVSWRKAVDAGLQQKQCVGEGGKIWVK